MHLHTCDSWKTDSSLNGSPVSFPSATRRVVSSSEVVSHVPVSNELLHSMRGSQSLRFAHESAQKEMDCWCDECRHHAFVFACRTPRLKDCHHRHSGIRECSSMGPSVRMSIAGTISPSVTNAARANLLVASAETHSVFAPCVPSVSCPLQSCHLVSLLMYALIMRCMIR